MMILDNLMSWRSLNSCMVSSGVAKSQATTQSCQATNLVAEQYWRDGKLEVAVYALVLKDSAEGQLKRPKETPAINWVDGARRRSGIATKGWGT